MHPPTQAPPCMHHVDSQHLCTYLYLRFKVLWLMLNWHPGCPFAMAMQCYSSFSAQVIHSHIVYYWEGNTKQLQVNNPRNVQQYKALLQRMCCWGQCLLIHLITEKTNILHSEQSPAQAPSWTHPPTCIHSQIQCLVIGGKLTCWLSW